MTVSSNSAPREPTPGLHGCSVGGKSPDVLATQLTEGDPAHASTSSTSVERLTRHTEKKRVRVLVLVDHGLFRASLGLLLASDQDLEVVGECGRRGFHVLAGVRRDQDADAIRGPDIEPLIIDITNPDHIRALATRVHGDPQGRAVRTLVNNAAVASRNRDSTDDNSRSLGSVE